MLYAQMTDKFHWPAEWDMVESMFKHLNSRAWGYQLVMEKKMFATQYGEEYRASLIKWTTTDIHRQRDVLLQTSDPKQMEAALFMLINETEAQIKDAQYKVSMVP